MMVLVNILMAGKCQRNDKHPHRGGQRYLDLSSFVQGRKDGLLRDLGCREGKRIRHRSNQML